MQTVEKALKAFHDTFGLVHSPVPLTVEYTTDSSFKQLWQLRDNLHDEEFSELIDAMYDIKEATTEEELQEATVALADAVCDLTYVIAGTCVSFGIPFDACFAEVQRSNMSKLGEDGKPIVRESDGKILKGPNFTLPDLRKVIYGR